MRSGWKVTFYLWAIGLHHRQVVCTVEYEQSMVESIVTEIRANSGVLAPIFRLLGTTRAQPHLARIQALPCSARGCGGWHKATAVDDYQHHPRKLLTTLAFPPPLETLRYVQDGLRRCAEGRVFRFVELVILQKIL